VSIRAIIVAVLIFGVCLSATTQTALAGTQQLAMFEDDVQLQANPEATLDTFRSLGVGIARVYVPWRSIAPDPDAAVRPSVDLGDPAAYPPANWAIFDRIVTAAARRGIAVDLTLSAPAPAWALGAGAPASAPRGVWKPSASDFGQFVRAVATRYSGHYGGLPRVGTWAIWNEPNFGKDIGPQGVNRSTVLYSPVVYRGLLDAAWSSLQATGHGHDTILIGSVAARGSFSRPRAGAPDGLPGNFGTTKPLPFIRSLYCVDSQLHSLRGRAPNATGCPVTAVARQGFRAAHPSLFEASGFAAHPYPINLDPTRVDSRDSDYAEFSELPHLENTLDAIQRIYGSRRRFPIYVTEYGYVTNPPNRSNHYVSSATAAFYDNWAEYLSWRQPRIATTMQYLLVDPNPASNVPEHGGFASGLEYFGAIPKPIGGGLSMLDAYRLPLFVPPTLRRGRELEVWGGVRPARYARIDTGANQTVQIQFKRDSGAFRTVSTVAITNPRGYFDTRVSPPSSGTVRLRWRSPSADPLLAPGRTVFSRSAHVSVR
jgi:hypothetical protein